MGCHTTDFTSVFGGRQAFSRLLGCAWVCAAGKGGFARWLRSAAASRTHGRTAWGVEPGRSSCADISVGMVSWPVTFRSKRCVCCPNAMPASSQPSSLQACPPNLPGAGRGSSSRQGCRGRGPGASMRSWQPWPARSQECIRRGEGGKPAPPITTPLPLMSCLPDSIPAAQNPQLHGPPGCIELISDSLSLRAPLEGFWSKHRRCGPRGGASCTVRRG